MKTIITFIGLVISFTMICNGQSIVSISPSTAQAGQTLNVTITGSGTHFASGSSTSLTFGFDQCSSTTVVNSLTINNDLLITANITVPSTSIIYNNFHDVQVDDLYDGSVVGDHIFDITGGNNYPISISPDSGSSGQTLNVTITGTGTHFLQGSGSVIIDFLDLDQKVCYGYFIDLNCIASSNTFMSGTFTIPPFTPAGYYDLIIDDNVDYFGGLQNLFHVTGNVGIQELENEYKLEISPNPFNQSTYLNYTITHTENVSIEIYDMVGRKVFVKRTENQSPGLHVEIIDAALLNLKPGIYLLQFSPGDKSISKRIFFYD